MTVDVAPPAEPAEPAGSAGSARRTLPEQAERGCRCGRRAAGSAARPAGTPPPLLRDDLIIAARQRNREPELPEETVQAALAATIPTEIARYDLIRLLGDDRDASPPPPDSRFPVHPATDPERLLGEFARRGHRVFWLDERGEARPAGYPAGTLIPLRLAKSAESDRDEPAATLSALAAARREHRIEAAVLYLASPRRLDVALAARQRWGWRVVTAFPPQSPNPSPGEAATVRPGHDAASPGRPEGSRSPVNPVPESPGNRPGRERDRSIESADDGRHGGPPRPAVTMTEPDVVIGEGEGRGLGTSVGPSGSSSGPTSSGQRLHALAAPGAGRPCPEGTRVASWPARWAALDRAIRNAFPRVSVVILSYDNRAFTRLCLWSLLANTEYPNYEVIVVNNGSRDGSVEDLRALTDRHPHLQLIANDENVGFGRGNNQGIAAATGEIFVLLNNDTMVPPGWLTRLVDHLREPGIGLIGPATNRACNEAQLDVAYATYGEFLRFAREHGDRYEGDRRLIRMPMMFCVALRRDLWERVGPLDERYEVGMFEDEDYALRVKAAGYETVWAPEVFIHHAYHASIGKLVPSGEYLQLFRANQHRFEQKWSVCWEAHRPTR